MIIVGIPVYNTNIHQFYTCAYSALAQTKPVQIVVVDDCSKEELGLQYKDFCEQHNIKYIRFEENRGVAAARNAVINIAKKPFKYLAFLDSDDAIMCNFAEVLEENAIKNNADVVISDIHAEAKTRVNDSYIKKDSNACWTHGKLYRIDYLKDNNICFPENLRQNEDYVFNKQALLLTKNIYAIDKSFYIWRNYQESLTRKVRPEQWYRDNNTNVYLGQIMLFDLLFDRVEEKNHLGGLIVALYGACQRQIIFGEEQFEIPESVTEKIKIILQDNDKWYYEKFDISFFNKLFIQSPYEWLKSIGVETNV